MGDAAGPSVSRIDATQFLSERSKTWKPSSIRGLFPLEQTPGVISLLAGKPHPSTFPFEAVTMKIRSPNDSLTTSDGSTKPINEVTIDGRELEAALQYGATAGYPPFVQWLEQLQSHVHGISKEEGGWQITVGSGSQDVLTKAWQALVDDGGSVLMEAPAFPCAEGYLNLWPNQQDLDAWSSERSAVPPLTNIITIDIDDEGLSPTHLVSVLKNWSTDRPQQKRPSVLYTIPTGSNPTGRTASTARKTEILKIAKEYNLVIMEDDAYGYLYYGNGPQPASYLSLEAKVNGETGRVVRFDSFSKILSSGMRLGFVTGPKAIVEAINLHQANSTLQCATTTQAMAYAFLKEWGISGFLQHTTNVANFYKKRRDAFEEIAKRHLSGVADWVTPQAGMFLFIKLDLGKADCDSAQLIRTKALENGVLAVPGAAFLPQGGLSAYVRVSFSIASEEQAEEGFRRLRKTVDAARV